MKSILSGNVGWAEEKWGDAGRGAGVMQAAGQGQAHVEVETENEWD